MRYKIKGFLLLTALLFFLSPPETGAEGLEPQAVDGTELIEAIPMRISAVHGRGFGYIQALETMAATINGQSEGRIKVELLLDGEAGSEAEALKKQILRKIEGGLTSAITMAYSLPLYRTLTIPMLFTAPSHVQNFIDSPLDRALRKTASSKKMRVLGYGSYGFYGLLAFENKDSETQNDVAEEKIEEKPVEMEQIDNEPFDIDAITQIMTGELNVNAALPPRSFIGLSVRTPVDRWMGTVHKALSVKQVTVPAADIQEALESGWIEGVVSTPETLANTSYPLTASHYFDIRQQHGWSVFTVNQVWFNKLPTDLQQIIEDAAAVATHEMLNAGFYKDFITRSAWAEAAIPEIIQPEAADLEAAFRPMAFKTARKLEKKLAMQQVIRRLWEENRTPQSNYWPLPVEPDESVPKVDDTGETGTKINHLMIQDMLLEPEQRAVQQ
ncbi:MAG: TRAP transporter substrate-binding protein DctP [Magnetococcales bacterium]|nr:TRAP transporter substrate-binding protein DctP [Magnetococcales bacterium]